MFNPSQKWIATFESLTPIDQRLSMARLGIDRGAATVAVGKLVQGEVLKPHFNRDMGLQLPGMSLEMVIYEVFVQIRKVRLNHARVSDPDYKLLELEADENRG
jgi:hypothetical protein